MNASDIVHVGGGWKSAAIAAPMLLAQAGGGAGAGGQAPPGWGGILNSGFIYILLAIGVFYIFLFRSNRTKQKQKQGVLDNMKRGDRVQTIGGILGTVVEARDKDVIVKVDESNNTKIKFARGAIDRILEEEKA